MLALPSGTPGGAVGVRRGRAGRSRADAGRTGARSDNARGRGCTQSVGDVYFPNWTARFGWSATGERTDTLNGRTAVTVYYGGRA